LPDAAVTVVHRADGSGTTAVFTDYLAKVNANWKSNQWALVLL
jgi:phosphate transport system substrate-binding protein